MRYTQGLMAAAAIVAAAAAHADGPGAYRWVEKQPATSVAAPQLSAIDAYNAGYAAIQRADELQKATDDPDRRGAQREAKSAYKTALRHLTEAVRSDPSMHEAYTYIGYAYRKLGRYEKAMAAYDAALRINPDYPHAIEYQGQAYLGLNRIEDAKFNYLRLYAISPNQAEKLLRAMQGWVDSQREKQGMRQQASDLAEWIAGRPRIAGDVSGSSW